MIKSKIFLIAFFLLFVGIFLSIPRLSYGREESSSASIKKQKSIRLAFVGLGSLVEIYSFSKEIIPHLGIGHFLQKDWQAGFFFLGSELGLLLLSDKLFDKAGPRDYQLYPDSSNEMFYFKRDGLSAAADRYEKYARLAKFTLYQFSLIDFFSSYRMLHSKTASVNKVKMVKTSIPSLMLSPFKPKYLKKPWILVPAVISGAFGVFSKNDMPISKANSLTMLGSQFSPAQATLIASSLNAYTYTLVACGEEMFFRGVLQTEFTERLKTLPAITLSSLIFGLFHVPSGGVYNGLFATGAGLYFGYRYHRNGYDLGEPIAAHFWWDFLESFISFLKNPRDTWFVYSINWKF